MQDFYPPALRDHGVTGRAEVTFLLDPAGVPRFVQVSNSSGVNEFDEAAIRVIRRARFSPPRLNGAPVWVRVRVPVVFSLT
jgi:protein TonB